MGRATTKKLHALGIKTIGELAAADEQMIKAHLKKPGLIVQGYARGGDLEPYMFTHEANKGYGNSLTAPRDIVTEAYTRSETALERPMFKESVLHRRAVITASGFYEWNRQKEKNIFTRKDAKVLFMAGFYKLTEKEKCFVILTTQVNASMEPVHERMPLMLEEDEINDWIYQDDKTEEFLHKVPC